MSIKRKLLTTAAVTALTAATAVPAMALENEFHGMFRVRGIISNFDNSSGGAVTPVYQPGTSNYIEQRARLLYTAKANDDLKLVTHFEIDSRWGDSSYNLGSPNSRNGGGAIGADQTNLETKNVYLDFNVPATPVNVKLGIQGFADAYKGLIFNNDAAGLVASAKLGNASAKAAYFRFDDANTSGIPYIANGSGAGTTTTTTAQTPGNRTRDFVNLGGSYSITKDIKVGADYYLLYSDVLRQSQDRTNIHTIGVNAEAKFGPATVDGFVLYQTGKIGSSSTALGNAQKVSAFAANAGAKVKAGPGTVRANALYISGERSTSGSTRHDFQTIMERGATSVGHSFYAAESQLLLRSKYAIGASDRAIVTDLNNSGQGLLAAFVGYDVALGKLFINSNLGLAAVAKDTSGTHKSDYLGTEINTEIGYKLFDNMTTSVQAAYLVLGKYFEPASGAKDPENPYSTKVMVNYTF